MEVNCLTSSKDKCKLGYVHKYIYVSIINTVRRFRLLNSLSNFHSNSRRPGYNRADGANGLDVYQRLVTKYSMSTVGAGDYCNRCHLFSKQIIQL